MGRPARPAPGHEPAPPSLRGGARGGVLLVFEREGSARLGFVPAEVALGLVSLGATTEVPGARPPARGIALADGEVVTVLELGPPPRGEASGPWEPHEDWPVPGSDRALLCAIGGQKVALVGGRVLSTGVFERAPGEDDVLFRGQVVATLDVRALYAQAETAIWAPRPGAPPSTRLGGGPR